MTFFRGSFQGSLPQGDQFVTNLHIQSSATLSSVHATFQQAATTFWNALKVYLSPATSLDNIVTTELDPATGKNVAALVQPGPILGTGTPPTVPQQTCILVTLRTVNASKKGRGRQYLPCPVIGTLDPTGTLSNAAAVIIDTAYGAMLTSIGGNGQPIILHGGFNGRDANGKPTYLQLSPDIITSSQVNRVLATQRRRTNKVVHLRTT